MLGSSCSCVTATAGRKSTVLSRSDACGGGSSTHGSSLRTGGPLVSSSSCAIATLASECSSCTFFAARATASIRPWVRLCFLM
eukprot:2296824-Prymnesium_polylepis.2